MIPPEYAPHRTETQRTGDDIVTAVRNLRHDWPHMIQPGETQAPGITSRSGVALPDHSPSDADMRRIDKTISLRRHVQDALNGWCRIVIEERGTVGGIPSGTDVPGMCEFVQRHAEWLGEHEAGSDCRDELKEFAQRAHLIVSPPRRETMSIGRCPLEVPGEQDVLEVCNGDVRSRPLEGNEDGDAYAACNRCGEVAVASWWESRMFDDPETRRWLTDSGVVTLVHTLYGEVIAQATVRQWVKRQVLQPSGLTTEDGRRLFDRAAVVYAVDLHKKRQALRG